MLNEEIYQKLMEKHGKKKMKVFTEIVREMYSLRTSSPPPVIDDLYDLHFWSLKDVYLNITTNEDGTDREII